MRNFEGRSRGRRDYRDRSRSRGLRFHFFICISYFLIFSKLSSFFTKFIKTFIFSRVSYFCNVLIFKIGVVAVVVVEAGRHRREFLHPRLGSHHPQTSSSGSRRQRRAEASKRLCISQPSSPTPRAPIS